MRHFQRFLALIALVVTTGGIAVGIAGAAPPPRVYTPPTPKIDVSAPSSPFTEVKTVTDGKSAYIQFGYPGGPLPIVTLGSGANVHATQLAAFPATYHSNIGKWDVRFDALAPGTKYWFQIDNGATPHVGVVQTMYRDVFVDFYRVDVHDDGDELSCGDFSITYGYNGNFSSTDGHCIDSGMYWGKYGPYGSGGFGEFNFRDHKEPTIGEWSFWMMDNDTLGQPYECGGPTFTTCGDLAYGYRTWDVPTAAGTTEQSFSVTGEGVEATARARITVSYRR